MTLHSKKATAIGVSFAIAAGMAFAGTAFAEDKGIEEIIVTAQSREQRLQDTPISVSVVSGMKLQEANIQKIQDLQTLVPNFTMTETGISTNIFIRGIGSGINQAFEQSVGYYVDGINYPRAQQARMPFLDLERVEVLRGPQTILFGKNSVAGALNITTAKPTKTFTAYAVTSYEFETDEFAGEGALSGPLSDRFRVRLATSYRESKGFVENLTLNRREPHRKDFTIRGTADYDISDNLTASFKAEYNKFDTTGRQIEILNERPAAAGPFRGLTYAQVLVGAFGASPSVLNNTPDGLRSSNGDFSNNKQQSYVLNLKWMMGEYELKSITAYTKLKYEELCDCDYTGANIFLAQLQEQYSQVSQELRFTSPIRKYYDFVAGLYYQSGDHDYADQIIVQPNSILIPAINARSPGAGTALTNTQAARVAGADSHLYAAFAQVKARPIDRFELQIGGRVTHEKKSGFRTLSIQAAGGGALPAAQAAAAAVYANVFQISSTNLASLGPTGAALIARYGALPVAAVRKETRFSPDVKLVFNVNPDTMVYASWSKGYKSGGFDFRANNRGVSPTMQASFEFRDERANNFEIGTKLKMFDGQAEVGLTGYYTKFNNLQISIFDGTLGFNVGNAASARVQGLEFDGRWRLNENVTLSGGFAVTDFKFTNFRNGQCYFGQTPNVDLDGNGTNELCNYTGQTNQMVADFQGNIALNYHLPIGSYLLDSTIDMFFTTKYHASNTFDPDLIQKGYALINARIGVGPDNGRWQVAVIGRNLGDKRFIQFGGDTPLSGPTFGENSDYAFFDRGRTVAIQARLNY